MTEIETGSADESRLHFVVDAADLPPGERIIADVSEREIGVFNVDGEYFALSNFCVHQGGPACEGLFAGTLGEDDDGRLVYERDGEVVSCPWHGWEYDVKTGYHVGRPDRYRLPTYDTLVRDGKVYVVL